VEEIRRVIVPLLEAPGWQSSRRVWSLAGIALPVLFIASIGACQTPGTASLEESRRSRHSVADVFDEVRSSVVTIQTMSRGTPSVTSATPATALGIGSGVLISDDGAIMTAAHVVHTADEVEVVFVDGSRSSARVISSDQLADVALVRALGPLPKAVRPVALGDSDAVRVGDELMVVGAPFGVTHTLTVGHLSARRVLSKELHGLVELELLQTDAAINTGNSGGPLFDFEGNVVGIVSHILSKSGGSDGLGFAISSNVARRLMIELPPVWSGLSGVVIEGSIARAFNTPEGQAGYLVQTVAKRSLGAQVGLRGGTIPATIGGQDVVIGGDIILSCCEISMAAPDVFKRVRQHFSDLPPGGAFSLRVLRDGQINELTGYLPKAP
jgi:S1-C subfamily serine protease